MPYTDPDKVRVALTPGGDDADLGSAASMSDDDLQSAIDDAQVEVDARLAGRYSVPFTSPVPPLVAQVTTDIAAYLATLTARRGDPILAGDPVALRNARAVVLLGQLQTGAAVLTGGTDNLDVDSKVVVTNVLEGSLFSPRDFPVPPRYPGGSGPLSPTWY